jgi:hypothetical protein
MEHWDEDSPVKNPFCRHAGPGSVIPDLIRDQYDGYGIQNYLKLLDSRFCGNDKKQ